jgi:hypothetical protein
MKLKMQTNKHTQNPIKSPIPTNKPEQKRLQITNFLFVEKTFFIGSWWLGANANANPFFGVGSTDLRVISPKTRKTNLFKFFLLGPVLALICTRFK